MRILESVRVIVVAMVMASFAILLSSPSPAQAPDRWDALQREATRLRAAGKLVEAEAVARRMVAQNPGRFEAHVLLAHILRDQDRPDAAADALRRARTQVRELPAIHRLELVQYLLEQVQQSPRLSRARLRRLLDEASTVADEVIASQQETVLALTAKAMVLDQQAKSVEQSEARRQALSAEADRLWQRARSVAAERSPAPAATPSPAVSSDDDEWRAAQQKASKLIAGGRSDEVAPIYEAFIETHPTFGRARVFLGGYLWESVRKDTAMPRETARKRLADAQTQLDAALNLNADDIEALIYKSLVLRLGAERIEPDPRRAKALIIEADRLRDRAKDLRERKKP